MTLPVILLLIAGALILLFVIIMIIGKISASSKKVSNSALAKKLNKTKKEVTKSSHSQAPEKKDEFDLTIQPLPEPEKKPIHKDEIIEQELDENDKDFLGLVQEQELVREEKPKPKSLEELIRSRQEANKANPKPIKEIDDEDKEFDKFRREHSSFISYQKDDSLINEIKNLSPEMKAIVFNNLFNKIDHDKF